MFFTSHKASNKLAVRLIQQLIQRADLLQDTIVQNSCSVNYSKCFFQIMAHMDGCQAEPALNV